MLGAARCGPRELKGPFLVPLFIGSLNNGLWSVNFHPGHNQCEVIPANNRVILVFLRLYSPDPYQTDSRSSRYSQAVPDRPNSLLSFKGKKNGYLSQLIALAVQARMQCWLGLR